MAAAMVDPNEMLLSYEQFGFSRTVAVCEEHSDIAVPEGLLLEGGRINLYEEVLGKQLCSIAVKGTQFRLKAGCFVGLIPLNDHLAIEVKTRVPIMNLERILSVSADYRSHLLPFAGAYQQSPEDSLSIIDLLADALIEATHELRTEGVLRDYTNVVRTGSDISGRVFPMKSVLLRQRIGRPSAEFSRYERTADIPINRCLKMALELLVQQYGSVTNRAGARKRLSRLLEALALFEKVSPDPALTCLQDPRILNPDLLPADRPSLRRTVSLAIMVLKSSGIILRGRGEIRLPTLLVNMETAFESYVRRVVELGFGDSAGTRVLNGNSAPPAGAAGTIFKPESTGALGNSIATPDTVVEHNGKIRLIIETKYKPQKGMPIREELDQIHSYAGAFDCENVVLVYPSIRDQTEMVKLGEISNKKLHLATINLGAVDFSKAENEFVANMRTLAGLL